MTTETKKRRGLKITLIVLIVIVALFFIVGFIAGNFFYNLALNPNYDRSRAMDAPINEIEFEMSDYQTAELDAAGEWFESSAKEDIYIESYDGLSLHSTMIKNSDARGKWLIAIHGYTGEGSNMVSPGRRFYQAGYNVLMPDCRGHGQSQGDYIGMGWDDRLDVSAWIDDIISREPEAQIVLYGISMGGATVMMTSGEDLPPNVKVIVEDCGYTSIYDEFTYQLKGIFNLPTFPIMNFSQAVTTIRAGYNFKEGSAVDQVAKSKTPIIFIHGDADTFVPSEMVHEVYEAANVEKELVIAEGAGHGGAQYELEEEYWAKVFRFVNRFVLTETLDN